MKKMILLGDSISFHYGPFLKEYLATDYEIYSKPGEGMKWMHTEDFVGGNGGDSSAALSYITERDKDNDLDFDLFVFNCGLHDIKRKIPEENYQVDIECYEHNLDKICHIISSHGIKIVFVNTTPVDEIMHCTLIPAGIKRYNADICAYNKVAACVAKKYKAMVLDLYSLTEKIAGNKYSDYAHFNIETRKIQAAFIAGAVKGYE